MPPYAQLLMTALGLGGNLMGMNKSANANNQYDRYLKTMSSRNEAEYNKDYNQNYLDTEEAKAAVRTMYDQMKEINDDADSSSAITGASAEKGVAMKEKLNKNFTQGVTQLSGQGTRRKDMIKGQYNNRRDNLDMMKMQNMLAKSQNGSQFAQNAGQLGISGLLMGSQGGFDKFNGGKLMTSISALLNRKKNIAAMGGTGDTAQVLEGWMSNFNS